MNYYIQGNKEKADQIKAAFKELGYNTGYLEFTSSQLYYTIGGKVELMCTESLQNLIKTHPDYKELELPKPSYDIANFQPFDRVLVRQDDSCTWGASFFGRYAGMFMCCNNVCFIQCIPYNDDTKHLLGTTDMPSEEYINW